MLVIHPRPIRTVDIPGIGYFSVGDTYNEEEVEAIDVSPGEDHEWILRGKKGEDDHAKYLKIINAGNLAFVVHFFDGVEGEKNIKGNIKKADPIVKKSSYSVHDSELSRVTQKICSDHGVTETEALEFLSAAQMRVNTVTGASDINCREDYLELIFKDVETLVLESKDK